MMTHKIPFMGFCVYGILVASRDTHDDNLENYDDHDACYYDVTPSNPLLPQSMLASG